MPFSTVPRTTAQGCCIENLIGRIPHRLALAGGWIDQPFVSIHNPSPPGAAEIAFLAVPDLEPVGRECREPLPGLAVVDLTAGTTEFPTATPKETALASVRQAAWRNRHAPRSSRNPLITSPAVTLTL
jgi:hypothetical protein